MSFLAPGAFFLGLLLPVIVALYLLKLRRIERPVPSTFLWRKMVRDVEANAPWQKLRPNLLMILQLLFLIALIIALARPFTYAEGITGTAAIFIIDSSASMASTDVQPSRIESAKQRASQLIDDLPGSARVTVIDAGKEAKVLAASSLDRRQAHLAVDGIHAGTGGSDMSVALELASAIAARQPGTEIAVLSDGQVELPQRITLKGKLRYIPFGLSAENQAISLLTLEPAPGGKSMTAFAQVSNYGDTRVDRRLSLYADGQLVNAFDLVQIPTGGQKSVIAEGLPPEIHTIEARLDGTDASLTTGTSLANDALPLDNRAYAVKPDTQPVPVTLVTQGNQFLKTALSLMPGVTLTEEEASAAPEGTPTAGPTPTTAPTSTATAAPTTAASGPTALTIYDNTLPDVIPSSGSLLFIAPPRSTELFNTTGVVQNPALRVIDPNDPLAANLSLETVAINEAVNIPLPSWATPVISGDLSGGRNIPLLFRGEVNGRRIAVVSFSTHVQNSDLALQVAFPLLVSNLVDWLVPGAGSAVPAQVAPGASLSFSAQGGAQSATITRPDGSTVPLAAENGRFLFTDTNQLGVYQVNLPGVNGTSRQAAFAVNLFNPKESSVKPADALPNVVAESAVTGTGSEKAAREWWRPLALLALGLLTGEWLVYQRAALVRVRDRLFRKVPPLRFGRVK